jgi:Ca-activated chloride channel family protein
VSFASPLWLLVLLAIPPVMVAQWVWRGRARRYALRFTAAASLAQAAAETGERWRGWLPLVAILLAVVALGLALGRPQDKHRVPSGNAAIMLVLDHSGSMAANDVAPSRIQAAIKAGNTFIAELPSSAKLGMVGFGSAPDAVQQPVTDHAVTQQLLDSQQANGGTDTGDALELALSLLHGGDRTHPPSAIVLLSDGAANAGPNPVSVAMAAKADKIPIYTVALGTADGVLYGPYGETEPVPPDPQLMGQIAHASGGRAFDAQTADEVSSIYKSLGDKLSSALRERDITVYFVLAGAVLLLLGMAGLVRRSARLAV